MGHPAGTVTGDKHVCVVSSGANIGQLGVCNPAASPSGLVADEQNVIKAQQEQIQSLQKQNEEFQQRLARLESLMAK